MALTETDLLKIEELLDRKLDEKLDVRFAQFEKKLAKTYITKKELVDSVTRLENLLYALIRDVNERLDLMQKDFVETKENLQTLQETVWEMKDVLDTEYTIALYKEIPDHGKRISRIEEKLALPVLADKNESLIYRSNFWQIRKQKKIADFNKSYKKTLKKAKLDQYNSEKVDRVLAEKGTLLGRKKT